MFERHKIGLSLGAGGARGLAHIGVLTALEKAGIEISFIAGSSMGALVGAAYAIAGNAAGLQKKVLEFIESEEYAESGLSRMRNALTGKPETWSGRIETWMKKLYIQARFVTSPSIMDSDVFRSIIEYFIPKVNIEDLPVPFRAMGTDLKSGKAVMFTTGSLRAAVYASSAIPGLVRPLAYDDMLIVDGGVVNMVPIMPLRQMGADLVIAVDVEKETEPVSDFGSAFDILFRVEEVQNGYIKEMQLSKSDLIIRPQVGHIHWSDFESANEMIRLGKDAAGARLDEIKAMAGRRKMPWEGEVQIDAVTSSSWIVI